MTLIQFSTLSRKCITTIKCKKRDKFFSNIFPSKSKIHWLLLFVLRYDTHTWFFSNIAARAPVTPVSWNQDDYSLIPYRELRIHIKAINTAHGSRTFVYSNLPPSLRRTEILRNETLRIPGTNSTKSSRLLGKTSVPIQTFFQSPFASTVIRNSYQIFVQVISISMETVRRDATIFHITEHKNIYFAYERMRR